MRKSTKRRASNVVLIVLLVAGLSLLYPTVSNLWNSMHMSQAIVDYSEEVSELDSEQYYAFWERAERYNQELAQDPGRFEMDNSERADYESQLRVSGTGIMGSIDIPSLGVSMPIYHGTEESVLQVGAGHIEGSSLPTGGKGTHCALSGHRGLPSSKLFTDIDKLEVGGTFTLNVLDRTLTYEVDQILTVDPYDMEALAIDPQKKLGGHPMKWFKRISVLVVTALALCLAGVPAYAHEVPDASRLGTISLTMSYDGTRVPGGSVTLYRVGDVVSDDGDYVFALASDYAASGVSLDDLECAETAQALLDWAESHDLSGVTVAVDEDGSYVYDVDASPKLELEKKPVEPPTPEENPETGEDALPVAPLLVGGGALCAGALWLVLRGRTSDPASED